MRCVMRAADHAGEARAEGSGKRACGAVASMRAGFERSLPEPEHASTVIWFQMRAKKHDGGVDPACFGGARGSTATPVVSGSEHSEVSTKPEGAARAPVRGNRSSVRRAQGSVPRAAGRPGDSD
jgi:hypothetical protein